MARPTNLRLLTDFFNKIDPKRTFALSRSKVTVIADLEIRLFARSLALPPRRRSAPHCAGRRRDADPNSCKRSRSLFLPGPL